MHPCYCADHMLAERDREQRISMASGYSAAARTSILQVSSAIDSARMDAFLNASFHSSPPGNRRAPWLTAPPPTQDLVRGPVVGLSEEVFKALLSAPRLRTRRKKYVKLLVVGDSGLGKTTLIRSLVSTPGERLQVAAAA